MTHSSATALRRAAFSLCAFACSAYATSAMAGPPCNAATTKGAWVYTCEGTLPPPPPAPPTQINTRILGNCTASKTGFFSCTGTVNLGGTILSQGLNGQATTLPNCTGTISYTQTVAGYSAPNLDINYVVSDGGSAINGLPTNSNGVLSCSLKRIDKDND
jgi:hypothetical protein